MTLCAVYFPPASQSALYANHVDFITELYNTYSEDIFSIFGDYNLPHAVWFDENGLACFKKSGVTSSKSMAIDFLLGGFNYCGLTQVNSIFNEFDGMLDLIFVSNINVTVDLVMEALVAPDAYHPPLYVSFNSVVSSLDLPSDNVEYFDSKRGDYHSVVGYLSSVNWDTEIGSTDPNIALDRSYAYMRHAMSVFS